MTTNVITRRKRGRNMQPLFLVKSPFFLLLFLLPFGLLSKSSSTNEAYFTTISNQNNSNIVCIAGASAIVGIEAAESGLHGHFNAIIDIVVQNTGSSDLTNLAVIEEFSVNNQYGTAFVNIVESPEIIQSTATNNPSVNISFDGTAANPNLLNNDGLLAAGQFFTLRLTIELHPKATAAPTILQHQATLGGIGIENGQAVVISDLSDAGLDPLSSNPNQAGDTGGFDDPTLLSNCWEMLDEGLVCNASVQTALNVNCQLVLEVDAILEDYAGDCDGSDNFPLGGYYRIELWNPDGELLVDLNPNTVDVYEFGNAILDEHLTVRISDVVYGNTCWGTVLVQDNTSPVCDLALDVELPINYDWDNDGLIENGVTDPSGADDLVDEYVLCSILDQNGVEIYFDQLEAQNVDGNNDGDFNDIGIDALADFSDCTGIDYIYFEEEYIQVCDLSDLVNIPIDESRFNVSEFAIAEVYKRTWKAIGLNGQTSQDNCSQYVFGLRPKGHRVIIEEQISLDCNEEMSLFLPFFTVDNHIDNNGLGSMGRSVLFPNGDNQAPVLAQDNLYFLAPEGSTCMYSVGFHESEIVEECESSTYMTRHWSVVDWCNGNRIYDEFSQLIKMEDLTAPVIGVDEDNDGIADTDAMGQLILPPTNIGLPTSYFDCIGTGNIPFLVTSDNCSISTDDVYNVSIERIPFSSIDPNEVSVFIANFENGGDISELNLPPGNYQLIYFAADDCGNESTYEVLLQIADQNAPVAICNDVLNITLNDFGDGFAARIYGEDLDDSSFDNCQDLNFLVRSVDNNNADDDNFQEWVEFDCADLNTPITVELLAFEDRNNDGQFIDTENNETGFNAPDQIDDFDFGKASICQTIVQVEERNYPVLLCENKTLNCDDPDLDVLFSTVPTEDVDGDGMIDANGFLFAPQISGNCPNSDDISLSLDIINIDYQNICKSGSFIRRFTATRSVGDLELTTQCDQLITVDFISDWGMTFPPDLIIDCESTGNRLPQPLSIDEIMIPSLGCDQWGMEVEDEIFDITGVDGNGACFQAVRTYKFINWCTWDATNTEIGIVNRPTAFITAGQEVKLRHRSINFGINEFGDDNDGDIYNEDVLNTDDGALIHLDNFDDPQSTGLDLFRRVYTDNINGGTTAGFYAENYGYFAYRQIIKVVDNIAPIVEPIADVVVLDTIGNCASDLILLPPEVEECRRTYQVDYVMLDENNDLYSSGTFPGENLVNNFISLEAVPLGTYQVNYVVDDLCGNTSSVSYQVTIVDGKAPTAYCLFGLAVDLMETGTVEVRASWFDAGSFDTCNEPLQFSFSPDVADTTKIMDCDSLGPTPQKIWVTDAVGNQAFCSNFVIVQPNGEQELCTDDLLRVGGFIQTAEGQDVEDVAVYLNDVASSMSMTGVDGSFSFSTLEEGQDYSLVPEKNVNPLNGVSTLDLVKIKKHILGFTLLDSPYKLIAADINRSNTITTFDLVELRKLILNVQEDFENNTSWRFVASDYVFPQPSNPWAEVFPEALRINDLNEHDMDMDFIAIKIGDVNDSAIPNQFVSIEDRNERADYIIELDDMGLLENETYTLDFYSSYLIELDDMKSPRLAGYQMTLHFDTNFIIFEDIEDALANSEHFGLNKVKDGIVTLSWEGDVSNTELPLFSFKITAKQDGQLSDYLRLSSAVTTAEAYLEDAIGRFITEDVILQFNTQHEDKEGVHLYQNEPNPFQTKTKVAFDIKEAGVVALSWYHVNGQLVHQITANYEAGHHEIWIDAQDLPSGLLYYSLKTKNELLTKKMINQNGL